MSERNFNNNNNTSNIENISLLGKDGNKLYWYEAADFLDYIKLRSNIPISESILNQGIGMEYYRKYYDIANTITTALASNPGNPDNANYNEENVNRTIHRNADVVVSNDGLDTLFVVVSHDGQPRYSKETPVYPGENKTYENVYGLKLRSPTAGLPYRVTEYSICCARSGGSTKSTLNASSAASLATPISSTISASSQSTTSSIDVSNIRFITITLSCTMNAAATADPAVTVDILTSYDGTHFDTFTTNEKYVYVTAIALALDAGNTRQKTSNVIDVHAIKFIEIVVNNKDAAQSITNVVVNMTEST